MESPGDIDAPRATGAAATPALLPAAGVLAGTCAAPHLGYLPLAAVAALIALGLALGASPSQRGRGPGQVGLGRKAETEGFRVLGAWGNRAGWAVAALGLGLLNGAAQPGGEPYAPPRRPVEVVAVVAGHAVRHDDSTFFPARVRHWRLGHTVTRASFHLQVTMPAGAEPPAIGATVRLRGYLRRSPGYANDPPADPGPWRMRLKSARFLTVEEPPDGMLGLAGRLRRRAERALGATGMDGSGPALARALLLGDRSGLPKAWQVALRRCGLAHVLAVSGLHVGLLAVVLLLAGTLLPPRLRYLPALAGIAIYLLLIGPRPAVLRAALMGALALAALALHRPPQGLNALACCAAGLALADPSIAGQLGFQLSVAATAGILVLAPVFTRRWTLLPMLLRRPLAATVAAQLATLPWTIPLAGGVHPLAPVLNLMVVPLLAGFLLLSFLWLALAIAGGGSAAILLVQVLDAGSLFVEALARLPPSPAFFLPLAIPPVLAAGTAVAALLHPDRGARFGLLAGLVMLTGARVPLPAMPAIPEVVMLDVGQGDAILLRDGRRAVLIDGGGWPHGDFGGRVLVPALAAMGIARLDAVVLTHPDSDHCNGLVDLTRYLPVTEVWMSPGWTEGGCARALLGAPARRWRVLWRGEVERVGAWRFEVLHPAPGSRQGRNDRSLVLAARVAGHRLLLTGDVEASTERRLSIDQAEKLSAGVLKVGHHGSRSSSTGAFLRAVDPRVALISAGVGNPHGHPHPRVLERLGAAGVRVLRTDRSGMLRLRLHSSGEISIALPGAPRRVPSRRR